MINSLLPSPIQVNSPSFSRSRNESTQMKTPPHSIVRSSTEDKKLSSNQLDKKSLSKNNDLLSPAFSSPQIPVTTAKAQASHDSVNIDIKDSKNGAQPKVPSPPKFNNAPSQPKKTKKSKIPQNTYIPLPHELPQIVFDSSDKPPYSYASLIGMAILRSEDRKLTLAQIYGWISETFKYYRKGEVGWQNSIRHNLSLNKSFAKTERPKDGKGHYWKIVEGFEYQFLKMKHNNGVATGPTRFSNHIGINGTPPSVTAGSEPVAAKKFNSTSNLGENKTSSIALNRSNTTMGLQHVDISHKRSFSDEIEDSVSIMDHSSKRHQHGDLSEQENIPSLNHSLLPMKNSVINSASTGNGHLGEIPELLAPSSSWSASASGDKVVFKNNHSSTGLLEVPDDYSSKGRHTRTHSQNNNMIHSLSNDLMATPVHNRMGATDLQKFILTPSSLNFLAMQDSPSLIYGGKNIEFTSSFSSRSTFDLSPLKPADSGTCSLSLLEPLTPITSKTQSQKSSALPSSQLSNRQYLVPPFTNNSNQLQASSMPHRQLYAHNNVSSNSATSSSFSSPSLLSSAASSQQCQQQQSQPQQQPQQPPQQSPLVTYSAPMVTSTSHHTTPFASSKQMSNSNQLALPHKFRTPINVSLRSPTSGKSRSDSKRLWNSPGYLDDFYTSPTASRTHNHTAMQNMNNMITNSGSSVRFFDDIDEDVVHNITSGSPMAQAKKRKMNIVLGKSVPQGLNSSSFFKDSNNRYSNTQILGIDLAPMENHDVDEK